MSELIDTTEMFLKAIWELGEDGIPALRARLTERLDQSGPSVSQTVGRMERDGLLRLREDRVIELSPLGRGYAMRVMRKHRLAELLLLQVLGLELELVHEEACRWEHVLSRAAEVGIVAAVVDPCHDPFGNPVPGLGELGRDTQACVSRPGRAVLHVPAGAYTLVRLGEPVQTEADLVRAYAAAGRGCAVAVDDVVGGRRLRLGAAGTVVELSDDVAKHVFVA